MSDNLNDAPQAVLGRPIPNPEDDELQDNTAPVAPDHKPENADFVSKKRYRKSKKELALDKELLRRTASSPKVGKLVTSLVNDALIGSIQNYANVVAIQRLGYNDHGPVHARIVSLNCIRLLDLLVAGGVAPSIVTEEVGDCEDAKIAVILGAFLHDMGMSVTREQHENHSVLIADKFLDRLLGEIYKDEGHIYMLKSLVTECIIGHMGRIRVNSVEAGIVMVGDGADCTKGRALIPSQIAKNPMLGDIHRFSATAIDAVHIRKGANKPVRIDVHMNSSAGLFQVEEVLIGKARVSPIMNFLEIAAHLDGKERLYLR